MIPADFDRVRIGKDRFQGWLREVAASVDKLERLKFLLQLRAGAI
jgi:hypothetical protein